MYWIIGVNFLKMHLGKKGLNYRTQFYRTRFFVTSLITFPYVFASCDVVSVNDKWYNLTAFYKKTLLYATYVKNDTNNFLSSTDFINDKRFRIYWKELF